jgi:hypothetical protein
MWTSELQHPLWHHMAELHQLHLEPLVVQEESLTEEEQDVAIGSVADAEAEEEFDIATDSSDNDYQLPILDLPLR